MSGGVEQNGNLAIFNGSVYYFNLTVPEGDYLVRLCDNSTREIRVIEEDDGMIPIIIIIIPLVMAVLFAYWAFNVSKEHVALQYLFFLMSGISCFISMRFAMLSLIRFYNWFDMESALGETYTILMIIFGLIIFYFCFYLFRNIILKLQEKKDEEAEL